MCIYLFVLCDFNSFGFFFTYFIDMSMKIREWNRLFYMRRKENIFLSNHFDSIAVSYLLLSSWIQLKKNQAKRESMITSHCLKVVYVCTGFCLLRIQMYRCIHSESWVKKKKKSLMAAIYSEMRLSLGVEINRQKWEMHAMKSIQRTSEIKT